MRIKHKSSLRLTDVMEDQTLRWKFEAYLKDNERSIENLEFVSWFEDYKIKFRKITPQMQAKEAIRVLTRYFYRNSSHELNLDEDVKVKTINVVKYCIDNRQPVHPSGFQQAFEISRSLIECSSIPMFISHLKARKRPSLRDVLSSNIRRSFESF
ncbi:hypothetical protein WALSEDRAFT_59409 [Wallemia mellicola CBS 633.66]|uniref:RGS domain-containing protein n=1 Tax=Wallemia mellicola (strain ATCC MYA-4683 / CBS 633.66) TaxID=671144 RepID=I4YIJ0_WALMC|nr:hypothetical protein WALSEDRAFT_59409 [Wallemia mellicola CBS 633.66]EIM23782.1 hypothetical protein WALSEDRAFT_59409 [Wallemia mellicola CBS 633.66]TIC72109.1 hypothetical protein E3Q00_04342 [Wallemia mellicola]|eukprot:XP_006956445.1 hypothetical protein WALSEDRAFT_59409 [Wallemia mellicola CBS 633.66]